MYQKRVIKLLEQNGITITTSKDKCVKIGSASYRLTVEFVRGMIKVEFQVLSVNGNLYSTSKLWHPCVADIPGYLDVLLVEMFADLFILMLENQAIVGEDIPNWFQQDKASLLQKSIMQQLRAKKCQR